MRIIDLTDREADIDKFYNSTGIKNELISRMMNIELVAGETVELKCADPDIAGVYDIEEILESDDEPYCAQCAMCGTDDAKISKYCYAFDCNIKDSSNLIFKKVVS